MEISKKYRPITQENGLLPEEAYKEYKNIYIKEMGCVPSEKEIVEGANNLIKLFKMFSGHKVRTTSGQSD